MDWSNIIMILLGIIIFIICEIMIIKTREFGPIWGINTFKRYLLANFCALIFSALGSMFIITIYLILKQIIKTIIQNYIISELIVIALIILIGIKYILYLKFIKRKEKK